MGIFKRKSGPVDLGKLQEERYKLLCRELQIAVENEYQSLSEIMKLDGRFKSRWMRYGRALPIRLLSFIGMVAGL